MEALEFTITRYWRHPAYETPQIERVTFRHAPLDERATELEASVLHLAKACHVKPNRWIAVGLFNTRPADGTYVCFEEWVETGGQR